MSSPKHSNTTKKLIKEKTGQQHSNTTKKLIKEKTGQRFLVKKGGIKEEEIRPRKFKKCLFWLLLVLITIFFLLSLGFYFFFQPVPGRTNFLILGVAGENHTGGDLTDTIIFASVDHQTGKTLVLSLPRDIWIVPLRTKLNSVYHYQGLEGIKRTVEKILGQKVDYEILINFAVFEQLIDTLGGVEVEVEQSFDDFHYPVFGKENDPCNGDPEFRCRYEHLHFETGKQIMDGKTALKYARSRFAEGEEGSDFARSKRQQKLILAIRNKILSSSFLRDPRHLIQLIKVGLNNFKTDIPQEEYLDLVKLAFRFRPSKLKMEVLNNDRLINPPPSQIKYDGQWVLVPKTGNWEDIHQYINKLLTFGF